MSIYINKDKKIGFIHIVKNGGSYICRTLMSYYNFERDQGMMPLSVDIKYFLSTFNKCDQLKIINKINKIILDGYFSIIDSNILNYKYFCVVRCPYQRFISGILYSKSYIFNIDMNNLKNFIINKDNLKNGSYNDLLTYSHVFVTQSQYIKNIPNLTILNFENLDKELSNCLKENGFDIILADSAMVLVSAVLAMYLKNKEFHETTTLLIVGLYAIPYLLYQKPV
jgi:hypothetical protein